MKNAIILILMLLVSSVAHAESLNIINKARKMPSTIAHAQDILDKVKTFTGLNVDIGMVNILVFETKGDMFLFFQQRYGSHGGFVSWYDRISNTIYTFPGVTPNILAHEFTHVLVDRYIGVKLPSQIEEVLPHYVEEHIKL